MIPAEVPELVKAEGKQLNRPESLKRVRVSPDNPKAQKAESLVHTKTRNTSISRPVSHQKAARILPNLVIEYTSLVTDLEMTCPQVKSITTAVGKTTY